METTHEVGDPVWAKMKGYPPWPAKIAEPPSDSKGPKNKKSHYVYFFGTENYAWIQDEHINPHNEAILNTLNKKKPVGFQNAIEAIVKYSNSYLKKRQSFEARKKNENDLPAKVKGKQVSEMQKNDNISTPSKKKILRFEITPNLNQTVEEVQSASEEKKENSATTFRKRKQNSEIDVTCSPSKNEKQVSVGKGKSEFLVSHSKEKKLGSQEKIESTVDSRKKRHVSREKEKKELVSSSKKKNRTSEEEEIQFIIASCKKEQSELGNFSSRKVKQTSEEKEFENTDILSREENIDTDKTTKEENIVSFKKRKHTFEKKDETENLMIFSNDDKKVSCKKKDIASPKKRKINNELVKNENIVTISQSNKHKQTLQNKHIVASSNKVEILDSDTTENYKSISPTKETSVKKSIKSGSPVKSAKNISKKRLINKSTSEVPVKEYSDNYVNKNMSHISQHPCLKKEITEEASSEDLEDYEVPSKLKFGFIGLGMMGRKIVTRLLQSGHDVTVWNKTLSVCDKFIPMGAKKAHFPAELIVNCDVTFSCVADPDACKKIIFCEHGVLEGFEKVRMLGQSNKGYVELSNIDPICSKLIAEAIDMKNGRYLEAPLVGTSKDVELSTLIVIGAGNRTLFKDCISCFTSIGKRAIYISSEIGYGTSMSLIVNMLSGTVCAALAEAVALTERLKLQKDDFLECLKNGPLACKTILDKANMMINSRFQKETALKLVQKDISLSLLIGDTTYTPTPVIATANEVYKRARLSKYSEEDVSAVYKVAKY